MLYYILAILAIGLIILIHEGGHFLLARMNGVGVVEFSIGFGPRLLSAVWHGTRYSIKAIPFGGSCLMRGEAEALDDPEIVEAHENKDDWFDSKPVWGRISVILAGPIFNILLGFVCATIVLGIVGVDLPYVQNVIEGYPAQDAGIQKGDRVISINNTPIVIYRDLQLYFDQHQGETVSIRYERDGEEFTTSLTPKWDEEAGKYYYGFSSNLPRTKLDPLGVIAYSANEVKYSAVATLEGLKMMVTGKAGVNDLSGPVGVTQVMGQTAQQASKDGPLYVFLNLLNISVSISVCLGIMNLLPLPALDGGRLIFLLFEAFTGKRVPKDKENIVHMIGIILLLGLSVVVLFNDIRKLFA